MSQDLLAAGEKIWDLTRAFNWQQGFFSNLPWGSVPRSLLRSRMGYPLLIPRSLLGGHSFDNTLPDRLFQDPVPAGPSKGQVVNKHPFETMKKEYYEIQGWETNSGKPSYEFE